MSFIKVCGITTESQILKIAKMKSTHIGVIYFEKKSKAYKYILNKKNKKKVDKNLLMYYIYIIDD